MSTDDMEGIVALLGLLATTGVGAAILERVRRSKLYAALRAVMDGLDGEGCSECKARVRREALSAGVEPALNKLVNERRTERLRGARGATTKRVRRPEEDGQ